MDGAPRRRLRRLQHEAERALLRCGRDAAAAQAMWDAHELFVMTPQARPRDPAPAPAPANTAAARPAAQLAR